MNLKESIAATVRDINRQAEKLVLYQEVSEIFSGIQTDANVYIYRSYGGEINVQFSPSYADDASKDLRPLIHTLARKFHVKFKKSRTYDKESLTYRAQVYKDDKIWMYLEVMGVVPPTCHVEEKRIPLSPEEIEEAREKALKNVQTERIERIIVCN